MKRILLDGCIPAWIRHALEGHDVVTTRYAGLSRLPDADLLKAMRGRFDVLVTMDRNMKFQQNIDNMPFSVIVIAVTRQNRESFEALLPALLRRILWIKPGAIEFIGN